MIFLWIRISQSDDPKGLFCPVVWFSIQTYWWNTSTDLKPLKIIFSLAVFLIGSNVCLMTRSAAIRHEPSNYFQIEEVMETNPVISSQEICLTYGKACSLYGNWKVIHFLYFIRWGRGELFKNCSNENKVNKSKVNTGSTVHYKQELW